MKRKLIAGVTVIMAGTFIGLTKVSFTDGSTSNLLLKNVQALSQYEYGVPDCGTSCSWEFCGSIYHDGGYFTFYECSPQINWR